MLEHRDMEVRWWCTGCGCCDSPPPEDLGVDQRLNGRAGPVDHPLLLERRLGRGETGDRHARSEEHTSELQSQSNLVCRLLLEKKKTPRRITCMCAIAPTSSPHHGG